MPAASRLKERAGSTGYPALKVLAPFVIVLWSGGVIAGFAYLSVHSGTAGGNSGPPPYWPPSSVIPQPTHRPTLLIFVHPHCACSRASLSELNRLLAEAEIRPEVWILACRPTYVAPGWEQGELWDAAQAQSGARVLVDHDGAEARRFRVETSGTVMLYDAHGCLSFHGGVTPARGHVGDNPGRSSVVNLLSERPPLQTRLPVHGCPLFGGCPASP